MKRSRRSDEESRNLRSGAEQHGGFGRLPRLELGISEPTSTSGSRSTEIREPGDDGSTHLIFCRTRRKRPVRLPNDAAGTLGLDRSPLRPASDRPVSADVGQ